jgi:hypothetical protein
VEGLVYPQDRLNIGIDYDATATTNIPFWQNFARMAQAANYDVYIVTARHPNRIEEPKLHFEGLVKGIIATSHKAKMPFCQDMGLRIDIAVDDSMWNWYVNIDGSTPKFESLSFMHPDFGAEIADLIFPRNHPLCLRGFGFYYTDMRWECPMVRHSFHRTKAGAYRAMRKFLVDEWNLKFDSYRNAPRLTAKRHGHWHRPFDHAKWGVFPDTIEVNE